MTYELLLEIFSMEIPHSSLYRNWSVIFIELLHFTLAKLNFFRCTLRSVAKHVIAWDRSHAKRDE